MRIAIVTGASSGLGREYARWVDAHRGKGRGFDELWVIARRRERLEQLAAELAVPVRVLPLDLGTRGGVDALADELQLAAQGGLAPVTPGRVAPEGLGRVDEPEKGAQAGESAGAAGSADGMGATGGTSGGTDLVGAPTSPFEVGMLVNAAGFGRFQYVEDMSLDEIEAMVDLNCRAVVEVTRVCLPYMHRGARVLQVASCAGFQPLQGLSEYAASKAFVISYTRSQRWELIGRGIYMTAVCPIWVKTEFNKVAREGHAQSALSLHSDEGGAAAPLTVRHTFPNLSPRQVVDWSYLVNSLDYPIATCAVTPFLMRVAGKVLPAPLMMAGWEGLRRL